MQRRALLGELEAEKGQGRGLLRGDKALAVRLLVVRFRNERAVMGRDVRHEHVKELGGEGEADGAGVDHGWPMGRTISEEAEPVYVYVGGRGRMARQ